jgi:hypothetical protein
MRVRHAGGSRFYLAMFPVDSFIYLEAIFFSHYFVEFSLDHLRKLSETPFVPVEFTGYKGGKKILQPKLCFLGKPRSELHSKLFAFVNFGTRANEFLRYCYTGDEPSAEDIAQAAQVMLADPRRVYELTNGQNK